MDSIVDVTRYSFHYARFEAVIWRFFLWFVIVSSKIFSLLQSETAIKLKTCDVRSALTRTLEQVRC